MALVLALPAVAQAGAYNKVLRGLAEAGYNFTAQENFISGGADFVLSRQFTGETLDFGATELTLNGANVLSFTTGGRDLNMLEFSLNTNNNPFNYTLTTDTGNQVTTITGSFLMNATASINQFGFYDVQLDVSSRQTTTQDGRFSNEVSTDDFDIGPIDLRGNLYADLLAVVTDPIFQALGVDNIFAQFSASGQFASQLDAKVAALRAKSASGEMLTADEVAELSSVAAMAAAYGFEVPDISFLSTAEVERGLQTDDPFVVKQSQVIPEPSTLALLGLAIPALLRRRK
ncbi:MAG: PEP-CTERM sorting domain-containing protein [Phycisphaerales bacterium]|nr:PEP-CTERM sorting domain-containing protein [Phycisphaerales bacterium]